MTILVRPQGIGDWSVKDDQTGLIIVDSQGNVLNGSDQIIAHIPVISDFVSTPVTQTAGIQEAIDYASSLGGSKVYIQRGTYTINTTIVIPSDIELCGEGRFISIIQPSSAFVNNTYLSSINYSSLIWLSSSTSSDVTVQNTTIHDMGINISYNLNSGAGSGLWGIFSNVNWQNVEIYNMYMNGSALTNNMMAPESYNITIKDFITINTDGAVLLFLNASTTGQTYHDILVENIFNYIDQPVTDDRIAIVGNSPGLNDTSSYNVVHNIIVRNIFVYVESSLTSGTVNGVKFDSGINTVMSDVLIDGVTFWGNTSVSGNPVIFLVESYGQHIRTIIKNIFSLNTSGIFIPHFTSPDTQPPWLIIDSVEMYNVQGDYGILIEAGGTPYNQDYIIIRNFMIELANTTNTTNGTPVGIMLAGGSSVQGAYNTDINSGKVINGYTAISNNIAQGGGIQSTPYSYSFINIENVHASNTSFILNNTTNTSLVRIKPTLDYPQQSTNGTTAGTVVITLIDYSPYNKKYVITFSGYENDSTSNQTIDFPLAFSSYAIISGNNTGLTISASTTGITITAPDSTTTYSGIIIVEGY